MCSEQVDTSDLRFTRLTCRQTEQLNNFAGPMDPLWWLRVYISILNSDAIRAAGCAALDLGKGRPDVLCLLLQSPPYSYRERYQRKGERFTN